MRSEEDFIQCLIGTVIGTKKGCDCNIDQELIKSDRNLVILLKAKF